MLRFAVLFAAGILGFQQVPALPGPDGLPLLAFTLLLSWHWSALRPLAWLLFGYAWAQGYAMATLPATIPGTGSGPASYLASGTLVSLPERLTGRTRFVYRVHQLAGEQGVHRGDWRVRVSWPDAPALRPGQVWRLPLRLKPVHGYASPGAWDYEGHLYRRGIRYTGYVRGGAAEAVRIGVDRAYPVLSIRHAVSRWLDGLDASPFARGVMRALVVADRSGLSTETRRLFRETGTSHLMAVSGLHIGLMAGMGFLLTAALWRHLPPLCSRVPARIAATLAGLACAGAYAMLAGMQLPTQRALIMLSVYATAFLLRRRAGAWHPLALASVAVLLWHPPSVLEAGFWLSFGAVAVIIVTLQRHQGAPRWRQTIHVQLTLTLALWPLLALFGMPLKAVAPLVNLLLVPVFGLLVVPLSLGGTALGAIHSGGGAAVLETLATGLDGLEAMLVLAASTGLPFPGLSASPVLAMLMFFAMLLWLQPPGLPVRPLAGVLLLGVFLPREEAVPSGEFRLQVLDVGQGLAVVVQTRTRLLVFDTGPAYNSGFSTAAAVLVPYLQWQGEGRIDRLVVSHGDRDHAGGLEALLERMRVTEVLSGEPGRVGFDASPCRAGERWSWDGVLFEFLHPEQPTSLRGNNASCVLRISNTAGSALLTGDIERAVERALIERHGDRLRSRLVIASHHGSRSSSSPPFVANTRPDYVVHSAGWGNRYGFPAAEVVRRWRTAGAVSLETAKAGTIGFRFARDGRLVGPSRHRAATRRYWRHGDGSATDVHTVSSAD